MMIIGQERFAEALKQRNVAVDYFYSIIDKVFVMAAGEMAITISFATLKSTFQFHEKVFILIIWILLFLTILCSLISFWGRFKTQISLSQEVLNSNKNTVITGNRFYGFINWFTIIVYTISNSLILYVGIMFLLK